MARDAELASLSRRWMVESARHKYSYHFTWLGRPVIQYPQDLVALQEIIWAVRPRLVVETGVARGGSLIFSASILEMIGEGEVVGVELALREHNREAIESHPLSRRITLVNGSSVDERTVERVRELAAGKDPVLVLLDSNHTRDHVLAELRLYSALVKRGSYIIVYDTIVEDVPGHLYPDRPWGLGNSPKSAVADFLRTDGRFEVDAAIDARLQITVAPGGYLRCISD